MAYSSDNSAILYDITTFSMLDWEGYLSAILWFAGCNMRCRYCHNKEVVQGKPNIQESQLIKFLNKRKGMLDAVVFSGGECTLYDQLPELATKIKKVGYKVKVDTNGTNPEMIKKMLERGSVDFISLDYKATAKKYEYITNHKAQEKFFLTLQYLIEKGFDFEVRTTIHSDLLHEDDLNHMISILYQKGYSGTFYIQNYTHVENNMGQLPEQKRVIDTNKIRRDLIKIGFRNF